jgi:hypothetical protein
VLQCVEKPMISTQKTTTPEHFYNSNNKNNRYNRLNKTTIFCSGEEEGVHCRSGQEALRLVHT